jgi:tetratricopeptide (TPR) repeat protein
MGFRLEWHNPIEVDKDFLTARRPQFIIGLCRAHLTACPEDISSLHVLGNTLTSVGEHEEALQVDLRLVELTPDDPVAVYNLACSLSNLNRLDKAYEILAEAVRKGYTDWEFIENDPDMENLRNDSRYPAFKASLTGI